MAITAAIVVGIFGAAVWLSRGVDEVSAGLPLCGAGVELPCRIGSAGGRQVRDRSLDGSEFTIDAAEWDVEIHNRGQAPIGSYGTGARDC